MISWGGILTSLSPKHDGVCVHSSHLRTEDLVLSGHNIEMVQGGQILKDTQLTQIVGLSKTFV